MRTKIILLTLLLNTFVFNDLLAQPMPLVYDIENTGADCPIPYMPALSECPTISALPSPFDWADGRGSIRYFSDWRYRRAEIGAQIQNYEIGPKPPRPDSITASFSRSDSILRVNITVNGRTLVLASKVILPAGPGPFPAIIGMNSPSGFLPSYIFSSRNIAQIPFMHNQVTTYGNQQDSDPYYQLYGPSLNSTNTGQYSAWAWGVSRLIDGLELVQDSLPVDLRHIAVAGCSYAGKMALFAGAFDERIALTFAMESGGGGATSWRYSATEPPSSVEGISQTDHNWFKEDMFQFGGSNVSKLPEDHHELMAMVAPRALYVTGNPNYTWLSNPSCYVCSEAAWLVYFDLGIIDRFGYSIIGGHMHCAVPDTQITEISAFVDKFLLGNDAVNTNGIADNPYNFDLYTWMPWNIPVLTDGASFFGRASLVYPANLQTDMDTTISFQWNKVQDAEQYFIQVSLDPMFTTIDKSDSTTSDTVKAFSGLLRTKKYYWRIQAKSAAGLGPWSERWSFTTATSSSGVKKEEGGIPTEYSISQNYPNPFNPTTIIKFSLPQKGVTKIAIYDLQGREIRALLNSELDAGYYEIKVNASNFPSGVYFYRIQSGNFIQSKKMLLLK